MENQEIEVTTIENDIENNIETLFNDVEILEEQEQINYQELIEHITYSNDLAQEQNKILLDIKSSIMYVLTMVIVIVAYKFISSLLNSW